MKLKPDLVLAAALLFLPIGGLRAAETELAGALQKGLFEEEANHNLTAAKESYQAVVGKFDEDRKLAATAVFRLGECYRKEGKTAEANQQYERILREFSDQTDLVKSSQTALGPRAASAQAASPVEGAARSAESEEDAAIRSLTKFLQDSPDMINSDKGKDEMTPLQEAVSKGQMRVAAWLLEHKAEINFSNDKGTALHLAVASGNRSLSEFLLSHGANPNARGLGGQTPLQLAVSKRFKSICELLLKNKADVNARDNQQDTALLWATAPEGADLGIVELLLANKADPEACSALWHSAFHKNIEVAKCLLAHGANVNAPEKNPPLGRAIENGNKEMVELLLDHKADPNLRDWNKKNGNGMSMLASAIRNNRNSAIPPMLIAHGADVNRLDEGGESPLFWALDRANAPMVELLLKSKADPNLCVNKTPLLVYAVLMRNLPIAKLLVAHGADVNKNDAEGNSPLFCAIRQEHVPVDILELLL
jgi:ankyrin repeat protein